MAVIVEFPVPGIARSFRTRVPGVLGGWKAGVNGAAVAAVAALPGVWVPIQPPTEVAVTLIFFYAGVVTTPGDVDNLAKPVLDAMNGTVYKDDKQVLHLRLRFAPTMGPYKSGRASGSMGVTLAAPAPDFTYVVVSEPALPPAVP